MITLTLRTNIQCLLEQVYSNPEQYLNSFELEGRKVNMVLKGALPIPIGELNTDIPSVALKLLKIKSWRVDKNLEDTLSLALNLII
jgi:hypothetical protein